MNTFNSPTYYSKKINDATISFYSALDVYKSNYINCISNCEGDMSTINASLNAITQEMRDKINKMYDYPDKIATSSIMMTNSKELYNKQYYYNMELLMGILLICGGFATI